MAQPEGCVAGIWSGTTADLSRAEITLMDSSQVVAAAGSTGHNGGGRRTPGQGQAVNLESEDQICPEKSAGVQRV